MIYLVVSLYDLHAKCEPVYNCYYDNMHNVSPIWRICYNQSIFSLCDATNYTIGYGRLSNFWLIVITDNIFQSLQ